MPTVVLASASPRRLDLLRMFGLEPKVIPADVDESPLAGEKPAELVERLARLKAETIQRSALFEPADQMPLIVAADTVIDIDGAIFGKPVDNADAVKMLNALSGRSHDVVTGMAVVGLRDGAVVTASSVGRTEVWIKPLSSDEIDWYLGTGEPQDKAGAYAIQGIGSVLIDRVEGSYQNVVGLSLRSLDQLTETFGYSLRSLGES